MSWRLIRPDPVDGGELPATEFVHPLPLGALLVLAVNDHVLKGAGWLPSVVTGKLSDLAGLFFFPLLLTACVDVLLYGVNVLLRHHRLDASLRPGKLLAAGLFTAALFTGIKLSAGLAGIYLDLIARLDVLDLLPRPRIVQDPTDLLALPMIALAVLWARRRLAEIPPARLAHLFARAASSGAPEVVLRAGLEDCRRAARRSPAHLDALVNGLAPYAVARSARAATPAQRERAQRALDGWRA